MLRESELGRDAVTQDPRDKEHPPTNTFPTFEYVHSRLMLDCYWVRCLAPLDGDILMGRNQV